MRKVTRYTKNPPLATTPGKSRLISLQTRNKAWSLSTTTFARTCALIHALQKGVAPMLNHIPDAIEGAIKQLGEAISNGIEKQTGR